MYNWKVINVFLFVFLVLMFYHKISYGSYLDLHVGLCLGIL